MVKPSAGFRRELRVMIYFGVEPMKKTRDSIANQPQGWRVRRR
jgi:hypothetical protein